MYSNISITQLKWRQRLIVLCLVQIFKKNQSRSIFYTNSKILDKSGKIVLFMTFKKLKLSISLTQAQ